MTTQIKISVKNISNDHCHLERLIEVDDSIQIPFNQIISSLLWLYNGLNVKVCIEQAQPFQK